MHCSRQFLCLVCIASLVGGGVATTTAHAQAKRTITVFGSGAATAPPDYVRIKGSIYGAGETGEEAYATYLEAKKRIKGKLDGKEGKLTLVFSGESVRRAINQPPPGVFMPAGPLPVAPVEPTSQVEFSEGVELHLPIESDMERMQIAKRVAETMAQAKKAGLQFNTSPVYAHAYQQRQPGPVKFYVQDSRALRAHAAEAAMAKARAQATTLAKLAGGNLGKVISIDETEIAPGRVVYSVPPTEVENEPDRPSTTANRDIRFTQNLKVVFELID